MLTESNFHHRSHLNSGPVIPQHRAHYAPYQHPSHTTKSTQQIQPQQQQQQQSELQLPKFDLHHAVRTNDVSGIVLLHSRLRQQPMVADTCLLDSNGHTPLYTAIANGRLAMVDLLLHLGHNPVSLIIFKKERGKNKINITDYIILFSYDE
jgi:ankyrin repeat protein